jgi:hypothetical protein
MCPETASFKIPVEMKGVANSAFSVCGKEQMPCAEYDPHILI